MKILITGGAGFIGSHLAEALLARGDKVTALDDLSTGSVSNVQHLRDSPDFSLRVGSCLDKPLVAELVVLADVTVHLAAAVGVRLIVERPVHTIETNVRATEVVLEAAARKGKKVFDCGPEEPCRLTTPRPRAGLPEAKPSRPRSSRSYGAPSAPERAHGGSPSDWSAAWAASSSRTSSASTPYVQRFGYPAGSVA